MASLSPLGEGRLEVLNVARSRIFVRNLAAGELLELFLIAAVSAVVLIRFALSLTGYPRLGGGGLHIAHMLWGGLLMLLALILLLVYLGQRILRLAAAVAGAGFGTFIDELGKFITSDNNYFYRPTMALIYLTFVCLFLVIRGVRRQRAWSEETYVINVLVLLQEAVLKDLDAPERTRAMAMLREVSARGDGLGEPLRHLLERLQPVAPERRPILERLLARGRLIARRLLDSVWLVRAVAVYFCARALIFVIATVAFVVDLLVTRNLASPVQLAAIGAGFLSNSLGVLGVLHLFRRRVAALLWFKRSVVISIFLVDVFAFYQEELAAVSGLAFDLALFLIVNALLQREEIAAYRRAAEGSLDPAPAG